MTSHNPNTRRCPFCREWIALPVRHPIAAFNAHKEACQPSQRDEDEHIYQQELARQVR